MGRLQLILVMAGMITQLGSAHATTSEDIDCMNASITLNVGNSTSKEGLLQAFQILSREYVRDSFYIKADAWDETLGVRVDVPGVVNIGFTNRFPNATPEYKVLIRKTIEQAGRDLKKIPGVWVSCLQVASPQPGMSGGM